MKPKIVYVDDDVENFDPFIAQLDEQEWEVICFSDPLDALTKIGKIDPCIVISDQRMPQMQGSDFLTEIKQKLPYAMRIIITGYSAEQGAIDAINLAKVFEYLKKPYKKGQLESVIRRAYDQYSYQMLSHSTAPLSVPDGKKKMVEDLTKKSSPDSDLRRIQKLLENSNTDLKLGIPNKTIEDWSVLVDSVMSARYREYHTNEHIFTMAATDDPIEVLAAIFHDLAYIQVDRRIHPLMAVYLPDFELNNETDPDQKREPKATDQFSVMVPKDFQKSLNCEATQWVCDIFSIVPEQKLTPMKGLNEFLSAVFTARTLGSYLKGWDLFQVLLCIEATIPFRKAVNGQSVAEQVRAKVAELIPRYGLKVTEDEIEKALKRWINVANLDVITFSSKDIGLFLANTWTLILEGNSAFNNPSYTISEYRVALGKNEGFFKFLVPEVVYRRYKDFPVNYQSLVDNCTANLKNSIEYINAKQVAVLAQETIALLTGGMCPIALFNGKKNAEPGEPANQLENYLDHSIPRIDPELLNPTVYQLLHEGRPLRAQFDLKNSPLATYFYTRSTPDQRAAILEAGRAFWSGDLEPIKVLKLYPKKLILSLLSGLKEIASTRATEFSRLADELKK